MKIGMIFPGQGSQFLGMGKDVYNCQRLVQESFEEASNCLDQNFVRLCFASSERELRETVNAQTSIFLISAAFYDLLKIKYGIVPSVVAGHSSGEYAALYAAGGISFPDALYLLKKRALFMDEATKKFPGTMLAVIGMPYEQLADICQHFDDPSSIEQVAEVVNLNSPEQFVVSGTVAELDAVALQVRNGGGKCLPLNVAGAFHSRLMREAEKQFALYMVKVDFKDIAIPLINNLEACPVQANVDIKRSLAHQMSSHVLWWQSIQQFKDCDIIIEVGPGGKLAKIIKRQWPEKQIFSCDTLENLRFLLAHFGKELDCETEDVL